MKERERSEEGKKGERGCVDITETTGQHEGNIHMYIMFTR